MSTPSTPPPANDATKATVAVTGTHPSLLRRLTSHLPAAQMGRYLVVGIFNTVFGYSTFAVTLFLLSKAVPQRYLYLTVIAASLISTPLNITVAFLGYKYFVFKSRGHFLIEWLRCFGVYGVGMLPGLLALSGITKLLQSLLQSHQSSWQSLLLLLAAHLHSPALSMVKRLSAPRTLAGYIAGALVQGFTIVFSFIGHKKVTFRQKASA